MICPECNRQVSDKAATCPGCGYPMLKQPIKITQSTRRRRLPNGFGRITRISNKSLRKPYRVMVSIGKDSNGRPIGRLLKPNAYFETYNEAYRALMKYHENPYDFSNDMTVSDLYDKWYEYLSKNVSSSRLGQIKASWEYCDTIKNKYLHELKIRDIKYLFDNGYKVNKSGKPVYPTEKFKQYIRLTLSQMLDYAVEYEFIERNFIKDIKMRQNKEDDVKRHISFTDEEMDIIELNASKDRILALILIECYTGLRPSELCNIETKNITIENSYFIAGSKTAAGRNRTIPIHSKIKVYINELFNEAILRGSSKLIDIDYQTYSNGFMKVIKEYNLSEEHRPHDCRKQFVTMAKKAGVDEYAIKKIVGHKIKDITESVYTDRDVSWLKSEIEKIR